MRSEQDEELDISTDAALISALTPKQVGAIELKPFSLMRQVISIDLCRASKGHFFNAIMTVWVCTLEPLEALQAHEDIRAAQLRAFEWAEAQGYTIEDYQPLLDAYARLNKELAASTGARVRGGDGNSLKNDGGQPPL
jgi:hypothetical protein